MLAMKSVRSEIESTKNEYKKVKYQNQLYKNEDWEKRVLSDDTESLLRNVTMED